jgi:hypothetical protein
MAPGPESGAPRTAPPTHRDAEEFQFTDHNHGVTADLGVDVGDAGVLLARLDEREQELPTTPRRISPPRARSPR